LYELTRRRTRWHESGIQEIDQSTLYCQSFLDGVFYNCSGRRGVFFALVLLYYRRCLCRVDFLAAVAHSFPGQLMGWQETDDELLITKGRLWHRFTVVPYGRIQFVDVSSGPIARMYGLKTVKLHTASAGTDATIKGLEADTADTLRARLPDKARERMSGL